QTEQKTVKFVVTRQDGPDSTPYKEEFEIPYRPNMNIISALMEIQRNPVNASGKATTPVCWEANCLEEVCGACSMVITGKAGQASSTVDGRTDDQIEAKTMPTYPVICHVIVDRSRMIDALKRVKAWVPIEEAHDLRPRSRLAEHKRQQASVLSKRMPCG